MIKKDVLDKDSECLGDQNAVIGFKGRVPLCFPTKQPISPHFMTHSFILRLSLN